MFKALSIPFFIILQGSLREYQGQAASGPAGNACPEALARRLLLLKDAITSLMLAKIGDIFEDQQLLMKLEP